VERNTDVFPAHYYRVDHIDVKISECEVKRKREDRITVLNHKSKEVRLRENLPELLSRTELLRSTTPPCLLVFILQLAP
jgi:hypothetical protein